MVPIEGFTAYVRSTATRAVYREGAWELAAGSIATPSGGAIVDTEARFALSQILAALRQHGLIAS